MLLINTSSSIYLITIIARTGLATIMQIIMQIMQIIIIIIYTVVVKHNTRDNNKNSFNASAVICSNTRHVYAQYYLEGVISAAASLGPSL